MSLLPVARVFGTAAGAVVAYGGLGVAGDLKNWKADVTGLFQNMDPTPWGYTLTVVGILLVLFSIFFIFEEDEPEPSHYYYDDDDDDWRDEELAQGDED